MSEYNLIFVVHPLSVDCLTIIFYHVLKQKNYFFKISLHCFTASVLKLQRVSASAFEISGTASFSFSQRCVEREKKLYNELMILSQTLFGNPKGPVELGNPNTCAETKLCLNFILFRLKK